MKVHQGSVDTYLEDVILQSTEMTADEQVSCNIILIIIITISFMLQAREEIREQAETVNKVAFEFETS